MLARLEVLLPFQWCVPESSTFTIFEREVDGYKIRFLPPGRSDALPKARHSEEMAINGSKAFSADVLVVEFEKDEFDRRQDGPIDPPEILINDVINEFLNRVRYVGNAHMVRPIDFPSGSPWNLRYLTNEKEELEEQEGLCRERMLRRFYFSWTALTPQIWDDVFGLPDNSSIPHWNNLLLDAQNALPDIGPAIVLAYTALEVFISETLDALALKKEISPEFWSWIKQGGRDYNYIKAPSTADQFDALLQELAGISLKSNSDLWMGFRSIQQARNSFVHKGRAEIGKKTLN